MASINTREIKFNLYNSLTRAERDYIERPAQGAEPFIQVLNAFLGLNAAEWVLTAHKSHADILRSIVTKLGGKVVNDPKAGEIYTLTREQVIKFRDARELHLNPRGTRRGCNGVNLPRR